MNSVSKLSAVSGPPEENTVALDKSLLPMIVTIVALAGALPEVKVIDLDRSAGVYYVSYSSLANSKVGFLKRLFNAEDEKKEGRPFLVTVSSESGQIIVNAAPTNDPSGPEDLVLRERLIKIIREYST